MKKLVLILSMLFFLLALPIVFSDVYNNETMLVYWTSDENSTWSNATNYPMDGELRGTPTFTATTYMVGTGATYSTQDSDDMISFNGTHLEEIYNFTVGCWINSTINNKLKHIAGRFDGSNVNTWRIYDDDRGGTDKITWQYYDNDGDQLIRTYPNTMIHGDHKNLVGMVINQTGGEVHLMGFINATPFINGTETSGLSKSSANFTIGGVSSSLTEAFDGLIDECFLLNYSADTTELLHIWNNGTAGKTLINQISYTPKLNNCTSGEIAITFTFLDEENDSRVLTDFTATFNYNNSQALVIDEDNTNNFSLCIYPEWGYLTGDYTITYGASGYYQRVYSDDDVIYDSVAESVTLYLLEESEGITANFRVVDQYENTLEGVEVVMKVQSTNATIEIRNTDDSGMVSFWVDPDITYTFTFTKSGYETTSYNLRITSTDIRTVTLIEEEEEEQVPFATGISYYFLPSDELLNNNTLYTFVFNMTSSYWNITGCTFYIRNLTTPLNSSSSSFNGSQCIIPVNYNTKNQTTLIAEAVYQLNNTYNESVSTQYKIIYTYQGEFSLKTFIDDLTSFGEAGFNNFTRMLIALVAIVLIVGYASYNFEGVRDPEILIVLTWTLVFFFSYIGWFTITYKLPTIVNWDLNKWIVFTLMTIGGGAYMIRRLM